MNEWIIDNEDGTFRTISNSEYFCLTTMNIRCSSVMKEPDMSTKNIKSETKRMVLTEEAILADTALVEQIKNARSTGDVWLLEDFITFVKEA